MAMVDLLWHLPPTLQKVLIPQNGTMEKALRSHLLQSFRNNEIYQFLQEDIFVKKKPSKIVRLFVNAEMFSSTKT